MELRYWAIVVVVSFSAACAESELMSHGGGDSPSNTCPTGYYDVGHGDSLACSRSGFGPNVTCRSL